MNATKGGTHNDTRAGDDVEDWDLARDDHVPAVGGDEGELHLL